VQALARRHRAGRRFGAAALDTADVGAHSREPTPTIFREELP
jgi:hypothetical protein